MRDFSESSLLHLPIHRTVVNSLMYLVSLSNSNLLMIPTTCPLLQSSYRAQLLPCFLRAVSQGSLKQCLLGYSPHLGPSKSLLATLICKFFSAIIMTFQRNKLKYSKSLCIFALWVISSYIFWFIFFLIHFYIVNLQKSPSKFAVK